MGCSVLKPWHFGSLNGTEGPEGPHLGRAGLGRDLLPVGCHVVLVLIVAGDVGGVLQEGG